MRKRAGALLAEEGLQRKEMFCLAAARAEEERMSALTSVLDSVLASMGAPLEGDILCGLERIEVVQVEGKLKLNVRLRTNVIA